MFAPLRFRCREALSRGQDTLRAFDGRSSFTHPPTRRARSRAPSLRRIRSGVWLTSFGDGDDEGNIGVVGCGACSPWGRPRRCCTGCGSARHGSRDAPAYRRSPDPAHHMSVGRRPHNHMRGDDEARVMIGCAIRSPPPTRLLVVLSADGQLDVVSFSGPTPGFYERTQDESWEAFRTFSNLPNLRWNDPNLRFIDLDGDGRADIIITEDNVFTWYPSLGEDGFGPARQVHSATRRGARAALGALRADAVDLSRRSLRRRPHRPCSDSKRRSLLLRNP